MEETVTVRLPDRSWAECARHAEMVRAIPPVLEPASPPFDWATCVNEWQGERH